MRISSIAVLASIALFSQTTLASDEWGYSGQIGEKEWGSLGYSVCSTGKQQSPINITNATPEGASDQLTFNNHPAQFRMKKDSHNLYAFTTDTKANSLQFNGDTYKLESFHFHTPAEHEIQGERYPLEGHFIHQNSAGQPVVIGVFFKIGAPNPQFQNFIHAVTQKNADIAVSQFLTSNAAYYTYPGSLTTPPCAEGLTWVVLAKPLEISAAQLHYFKEHIIPMNSRSPQPLDGRGVAFYR